MTRVVITVPHAMCLDALNHPCDYYALTAALAMMNTLRAEGAQVEIFVPLSVRALCDMNRAQCRDTVYRRALSKYLHEQKPDLLIDVHSFPPNNEPYSGNAVVLLNRRPRQEWLNNAATALAKDIQDPVAIMEAADVNDIIVEADRLALPNVLVEFNEALILADHALSPAGHQVAAATAKSLLNNIGFV